MKMTKCHQNYKQKTHLRFEPDVHVDSGVSLGQANPLLKGAINFLDFTFTADFLGFKELEDGQKDEGESLEAEWLLFSCFLFKA